MFALLAVFASTLLTAPGDPPSLLYFLRVPANTANIANIRAESGANIANIGMAANIANTLLAA